MSTDDAVELPWGRFAARNGWYGVAEIVRFRPTTSVLVARHPLPIETNAVPPGISRAHTELSDWADMVSQLVILSVVFGTRDDTVAPVPTFRLTVLPFQAPFSAGGPMVLAPPLTKRELDESEVAEVDRWAGILNARYVPNLKDAPILEVAAKRVIAALAHRVDPRDRLIDAVTAWEALFGGREEATLRVSGSIAWLLEPHDQNARQALQA